MPGHGIEERNEQGVLQFPLQICHPVLQIQAKELLLDLAYCASEVVHCLFHSALSRECDDAIVHDPPRSLFELHHASKAQSVPVTR